MTSIEGFKYYIHFIDDFTIFTWIYPFKCKSEALSVFCSCKKLVENKFDKKIKCLQSNLGGEYRNFSTFLQTNGIQFRHPCPHTHPQNGKAERKLRYIVEMGLCLLAQAFQKCL